MISLMVNNSIGHPYERHPVSGNPDPLTGTEMPCMSCHLAHGGMQPHVLKMGSRFLKMLSTKAPKPRTCAESAIS